MKIHFSKNSGRKYKTLSQEIQKTAGKQFIKLLENPKTISLQLKKMQGHPDIWEIRITKEYRTTLQIENDLYRIRKIGTHDILKNP